MAIEGESLEQAKRHPDVVKNIIKKDGRHNALPYTPSNPPPYPVTSVNGQIGDVTIPSTEGSRVWYATCSTGSGTGAKVATSSTGDFQLTTGAMVRVLFSNSNTAANPTISIDGSTAKSIRPISSASGMDYMWRAGEVVDIVYDGSNFVASDCGKASTSFYGVTSLSSAVDSTSEAVAATPKAVKDAYDKASAAYSSSNPPPYPVTSVNGKTGAASLTASDVGAVDKTGDTMSGELESTSYFTRKLSSAPVADTTTYYATRLKDQNNTYRGGLAFFRSSTYGDGIRIVHAKTVNGTTITHTASLYIGDSGTPYVVFSYPSAWRTGLGVSADYKAGDTVSFTTTGDETYTRWAGDWRNTTDLYFTIPLTKPFGNLSASVTGTVFVCSNGTRNTVTLSNLSSVVCYNSPSGIVVRLRWASAPAFAVSYQPVTVQPYGFTITFS